jgi:glycosyltransferase involved in cell wall biosynthesis
LNALLLAVAAATALFLAYVLTRLALWGARAPRLRSFDASLDHWPLVSVVIAARNEERNVGEALQSVLRLDYSNLEVVFVNDRSTDRTGEIVRDIAHHDPRLRVIEIAELPNGWLGKNHALHRGAAESSGEILLFTDADVVFESPVLRNAVVCMQQRRLDHLTSGFAITSPTLRLRLFVVGFMFYFMMYSRPWDAPDPKSAAHVGIGGFNLVRANVYRAAGGHNPIAMRPDDDMMLGKLLKKNGARQELVDPQGMLRVEWYSSLREAARGFEKNGFSGVEYSVARLIGASFALFAVNIWPFIGMLLAEGPARWLNLGIAAALVLTVGALAVHTRTGNPAYGLAFPLVTLLFIAMIWRSALLALKNGGVQWKDTFYSLEELRQNRI